MRILLVVATTAECQGLIKDGKKSPAKGIVEKEILSDMEADLLITGVGQVATAFHLGKILANEHYDLAINIGLAGSFRRDWELGKVIQVVQDEFADLGVEDHDQFIDLFDLGLLDSGEAPFHQKKLFPIPFTTVNQQNLQFPVATGITVNTVHGNADSISAISQRFQADVESMEGAAFLYACNLAGIPSIQLRALSNYVEPRNRDAWQISKALDELWSKTGDLLIHIHAE
jgi:futalosine hydrolase